MTTLIHPLDGWVREGWMPEIPYWPLYTELRDRHVELAGAYAEKSGLVHDLAVKLAKAREEARESELNAYCGVPTDGPDLEQIEAGYAKACEEERHALVALCDHVEKAFNETIDQREQAEQLLAAAHPESAGPDLASGFAVSLDDLERAQRDNSGAGLKGWFGMRLSAGLPDQIIQTRRRIDEAAAEARVAAGVS